MTDHYHWSLSLHKSEKMTLSLLWNNHQHNVSVNDSDESEISSLHLIFLPKNSNQNSKKNLTSNFKSREALEKKSSHNTENILLSQLRKALTKDRENKKIKKSWQTHKSFIRDSERSRENFRQKKSNQQWRYYSDNRKSFIQRENHQDNRTAQNLKVIIFSHHKSCWSALIKTPATLKHNKFRSHL